MLLPHQRPVHFDPLGIDDYAVFYELEMGSYKEDLPFYSAFIKEHHSLLELGCGTGRLCSQLAKRCRFVSGLDISDDMIQLAKSRCPEGHFHQGDMRENLPDDIFDIICIPYNSLNLLEDPSTISRCLQLCRCHLNTDGALLLHLYHPDVNMLQEPEKRFFQFMIFERPDGGKIIKETLRSYHPENSTVKLEERYRIRPPAGSQRELQRDLRHILTLYAPPFSTWQTLLHDAGFDIRDRFGSYDMSPLQEAHGSIILIHARPSVI